MQYADLEKKRAERDKLAAEIAIAEKNFAVVNDGGSPYYLDGAQMQFSVEREGCTIAYFDEGGDAQAFADLINRRQA